LREEREELKNEILEHCALKLKESKLRPKIEYLALLTFKVKTFQNEKQDPTMQSSNTMKLLKLSRNKIRRNFG